VKKVVFALLICCTLDAQVAGPANREYQTKEGRQRLAARLDGAGRDAQQKPRELVALLDLKPGQTVADIGTGAGYMLPYLSSAVGPSGQVIAEDIHPDFLAAAKAKVLSEKLSNVSYVLGTNRAVHLPANSVDVVFVLDAYHHFDYPAEMIGSIREALKKDGRFIVVDYYKKHFYNSDHVRLDPEDVIKEVESHGLRRLSRREFNPNDQYILIFTKP
jgi:ubiquinone/menaquinone biosynthesis C-methylase UbiE